MKRRRCSAVGGMLAVAVGCLSLEATTCGVSAFSPADNGPRVTAGIVHTTKAAPKAPSSAVDAEVFNPPPTRSKSSGQSRTALENAVLVEWERRSELERRIEDGVLYEHFEEDSYPGTQQNNHRRSNKPSFQDTTPKSRGVFCGYRGTKEERDRLKSARGRRGRNVSAWR